MISNIFAETVSKIEINGNKRISSETIKVYGQIKPINSDFTEGDINKILVNLYHMKSLVLIVQDIKFPTSSTLLYNKNLFFLVMTNQL